MTKFKDGQRVKATRVAFSRGLFERKQAPVFGTIVGFKRTTINSEAFVRVRRDGLKSALIYHPSFWEAV
jgi:hypothetical protein